MELTSLSRVNSKALNIPMSRSKTRVESFCENCRKRSIKFGFCFICGFEVR